MSETPIAVVDLETTGLTAGFDRVVEVSVVRIEPGQQPALVLDTLVNPRRPVSASEIHGITDADVAKAPTFRDIAGDFVKAVSGSVVAAYNVYFDIRFVESELRQVGIDSLPPHFCLMYMRPMLGLGKRCPLGDACRAHGIDHQVAHMAATDAQASAELMGLYLGEMSSRGIQTFGELAKLKKYKFVESFASAPLSDALAGRLGRAKRLKSRAGLTGGGRPAAACQATAAATPNPIGVYWDALKAALADLQVTEEELADLERKRVELGLEEEQVRVLHARAFVSVISQFTRDGRLDARECATLRRLHRCLSVLGWAPGEP